MQSFALYSQNEQLNPLTALPKEIWEWAKMQGVWISAAHIPGQNNIEENKKVKQFKNKTEWMLSKEAFPFITK